MKNAMNTLTARPRSAALVGVLFALPFAILNAIVATRLEPFFSTIRPGIHTSWIEYILLFIVVTLFPVGAFIAIRPILRKSADGARRFYVVNGLVAALLVIAFGVLVVGLGSEIYRCDVLQVPNCD
jgi:hypothetical protein